MFPEWYKSFGFKEFDKELLEKEIFEGYEDVQLHQLNIWKQSTSQVAPMLVSIFLYTIKLYPHIECFIS